MTAPAALHRDPEFRKFWAAEALAGIGVPIERLAIPLIAVTMLGAGAAEMGLLTAVAGLPMLVFGLAVGVLSDRTGRRRLLAFCDLTRAVALAAIPLAAIVGLLRLEVLLAVVFVIGSANTLATVAYQALLPSLVGRPRLLQANSVLESTSSLLGIAGPPIAGALIQTITAPFALLLHAAVSLVSALLTFAIRVTEPVLSGRPRREMLAEVREGLALVLGDRLLRPIALCGMTHNFASNGMLTALYVLFATRELGLGAVELGIVFAAGAPGAFVGSVVAARLPRLLGLGPTIGLMQILTGVARLAMPLAAVAGPPLLVLAAGELLLGFVRAVFNVNQMSLRQAITPDHQQGRMNASIRFVMWAVVPAGALVGGWLGESVGLVPVLWVGVAGTFAAALWIYLSPVRTLGSEPPHRAEA